MSDITQAPPAPKAKRTYNRRAPIRETPQRVAEVRPEEVRPTEVVTRTRKNIGTVDPSHIPKEMWPEGVDLMWVTDSILGKPTPEIRQVYEINGWRPVTPEMFGGRFDGVFMPKGYKGEINVQGSVLEHRPMALTEEARAEERNAARLAVGIQTQKLRGGQIDGVSMDTQHPTARANTRVNREMLSPMPVPRD